MASKFIVLGVVALILSGASMLIEVVFFGGGVTPTSIVQQSFFLPLSFIFLLIAGAFLVIGSMIKIAMVSD